MYKPKHVLSQQILAFGTRSECKWKGKNKYGFFDHYNVSPLKFLLKIFLVYVSEWCYTWLVSTISKLYTGKRIRSFPPSPDKGYHRENRYGIWSHL